MKTSFPKHSIQKFRTHNIQGSNADESCRLHIVDTINPIQPNISS